MKAIPHDLITLTTTAITVLLLLHQFLLLKLPLLLLLLPRIITIIITIITDDVYGGKDSSTIENKQTMVLSQWRCETISTSQRSLAQESDRNMQNGI